MTIETVLPWDAERDWPYDAHIPQRYTVNRDRYLARGGLVRIEEDVAGFVHEGRNVGDMARFYSFCLVLDQLAKERLPGDIAELGVYKGDTATLLAKMARRLGKTAYLLDTFEGFNNDDLTGIDADIRMEFTDTSIEAVKANVGEISVTYIKGYFPASAAQLPADNQYCLVHIDCDLYAPMLSSLEYFYPRLVPGGYLLMHDYTSLHWNGAEEAIDRFFADKPESVITLPDGAGTAIVRKLKGADQFGNWYATQRSRLLDGAWLQAATSPVMEMLGAGWSIPEGWGVWGIGDVHEFRVMLPNDQVRWLELEVEANAVILGDRMLQQIDVVVAGTVVATWEFTQGTNLAQRQALIPVEITAHRGIPLFAFEFRPRDIRTPAELDSRQVDDRALGLGLHRVRIEART